MAEADLAEPVVMPAPVFSAGPDELAVPALLAPGAGVGATLVEFPVPPELCASEPMGLAKIAIATIDAVTDSLIIGKAPFAIQRERMSLVPRRNNFRRY